MARSTPPVVRVVRVSFESTRLSPQCLAETYARIVPITRKAVGPAPRQRRWPPPGRPRRGGLSITECGAAFYARVSSQVQARDHTIDSQVAALRERIMAHGATFAPDNRLSRRGAQWLLPGAARPGAAARRGGSWRDRSPLRARAGSARPAQRALSSHCPVGGATHGASGRCRGQTRPHPGHRALGGLLNQGAPEP